jgi:acyl carrier protein
MRDQLRVWLQKNSKKQSAVDIADDTNIIDERIITSVQTFDLITFIERITGENIDLSMAKPGSFHTINAMCATFGAPTMERQQ